MLGTKDTPNERWVGGIEQKNSTYPILKLGIYLTIPN
jgi:hypothetical protein